MRYRKKPVVIEAFQLTDTTRYDNSEWPQWMHEAWQRGAGENGIWINPDERATDDCDLVCGTLEGVHVITYNDWIIQGVQGEIYPCKPDIFELTYEKVGEDNEWNK